MFLVCFILQNFADFSDYLVMFIIFIIACLGAGKRLCHTFLKTTVQLVLGCWPHRGAFAAFCKTRLGLVAVYVHSSRLYPLKFFYGFLKKITQKAGVTQKLNVWAIKW